MTEPNAKQALFDRVRQALGHATAAAPVQPPPRVDPDVVRLAGPDENLPELFATRATEVGMQVQSLTQSQLVDAIKDWLTKHKVKTLALGLAGGETWRGLGDALDQSGFVIVDVQGPSGMDRQYDVDAGITDVAAALADTGTLVCASDAAHSRGPSLLPPLHVALVRQSDILPDMMDYWPRWSGIDVSQMPSSLALITGPSKTADIEGELITGVHGPKVVQIFLITDM